MSHCVTTMFPSPPAHPPTLAPGMALALRRRALPARRLPMGMPLFRCISAHTVLFSDPVPLARLVWHPLPGEGPSLRDDCQRAWPHPEVQRARAGGRLPKLGVQHREGQGVDCVGCGWGRGGGIHQNRARRLCGQVKGGEVSGKCPEVWIATQHGSASAREARPQPDLGFEECSPWTLKPRVGPTTVEPAHTPHLSDHKVLKGRKGLRPPISGSVTYASANP
eukprot:366516-Chlamydomonas_euryale.AAC.1